jgi:hypothetical protein
MSMIRALHVVFALSLAGVAVSGTLTYNGHFGASAVSCPAPGARVEAFTHA